MMGTGTKHAEAVIAWLAELVTIIGSGPAVYQWCLALRVASQAGAARVSHRDGAVSLRFDCARLSLHAV